MGHQAWDIGKRKEHEDEWRKIKTFREAERK